MLGCHVSSPETASHAVRPCVSHDSRLCVCALEAAGGTSHHCLAPKERGLSPAQCTVIGHGRTATSAARRARGRRARVLRHCPESGSTGAPAPRATRSAGLALEAAGGTSHCGRLCVGGLTWHVAPRFCTEGERPLIGAVPLHRARTNHTLRGPLRACGNRDCTASSPETGSAVARPRVPSDSRLLCVGGRKWYVTPRSCTKGKSPLADAVPLCMA